jgi:glutamate--cysteine ligase
VAALVVTLVDDPVAAEEAAELCAPVADAWHTAARRGLDDPSVRSAVTACTALAASRCPEGLRSEAEEFAELIASGRSPSTELRRRVEAADPLVVLEEEAHA